MKERVTQVSAEEFASLAKYNQATVVEEELELITEADLPSDWLETNIRCYSTEALYYSLAQYRHIKRLKNAIDDYVVALICENHLRTVLDVGVGDGHRLRRICEAATAREGLHPVMLGTELSESMLTLARANGIKAIQHDMRQPLPDFGYIPDLVLFLSGDFGYILDTTRGNEIRQEVLTSAHSALGVGGIVFMELVCRDPKGADDIADVYSFTRAPYLTRMSGEIRETVRGPTTQQYVKVFTYTEVEQLVAASPFELPKARMEYMVRYSADDKRIGKRVPLDALNPDENYRLLLTLSK